MPALRCAYATTVEPRLAADLKLMNRMKQNSIVLRMETPHGILLLVTRCRYRHYFVQYCACSRDSSREGDFISHHGARIWKAAQGNTEAARQVPYEITTKTFTTAFPRAMELPS